MDITRNESLQRILTPDHTDDRGWRDALARLEADDTTLTRRSAGEHVIATVQRLLIFLGYSTASGGGFKIDGDYGRGTNRGVAQFQFDHGLTRKIDRETLCYDCSFSNARTRITAIPETRLTVATLQRMGETALDCIANNQILCGDFEEALRQLNALHGGRSMSCASILEHYGDHVQRACEDAEGEAGHSIYPGWILAVIRQESAGIIRPRFEQHLLTRMNKKSPDEDLVELRYRAMSQGLGQVLGSNYAIIGAPSARSMYTSPVADQVRFVVNFCLHSRVLRKVVGKSAAKAQDFRDFARVYNGPRYETHHYHEQLERWFREVKTLLAKHPIRVSSKKPGPRRYRKKATALVTAVRLSFDFDGFQYSKWGGLQRCAAGDWLVDNNDDVYTVSADSFADTYEFVSPGRYYKRGEVWAEVATSAGRVRTKEGASAYSIGDYLVSNKSDGSDGYAVSKKKFEEMYKLINA